MELAVNETKRRLDLYLIEKSEEGEKMFSLIESFPRCRIKNHYSDQENKRSWYGVTTTDITELAVFNLRNKIAELSEEPQVYHYKKGLYNLVRKYSDENEFYPIIGWNK